MLNDIQQEKALTALVAITDAAVKLLQAGAQEEGAWAAKQASLLTSALAKRYWEEPKLPELATDEVTDRGVGLGEREAKVVEIEEAHEVGVGIGWAGKGVFRESTVFPPEGVALSALASETGIEPGDEAVGQVEDTELAPTRHRVPRKRSRG